MADRIVWDFETSSDVQRLLRTASNEFMEYQVELQMICREAQSVLYDGTGYSGRILDEAEVMARKIGRAGEEAESLKLALQRANAAFCAAEAEIKALSTEAIQIAEEKPQTATRASATQTASYSVQDQPGGWTVVPQWLEWAADQMFSRIQPFTA